MPDPITITLRGPIFHKDIPKVLGDAIITEVMEKVEKRVRRKGRKAGRRNNPIGPGDIRRRDGVTMTLTSSLNRPRTSGGTSVQKNMATIRGMAPRVIRKAGRRMAKELS